MRVRLGPRRRTVCLVAIVLSLTGVALLRGLAFTFPWDIDAKTYAYVAQRILEGETPYRDVWEQKPPGILYTYALVFWMLGVHSTALIGAKLLIELVSLIVLYALVRRLYDPVTGLVAALLYAIFSSGIVLQRALLQAEHPMMLFIVLSLFCLVQWTTARQTGWLLIAGVSAGLAITFKQNAAIVLAGPAAVVLLGRSVASRSSSSGRVDWWRLVPFVAGALAPIAGWAVYFWARGALDDLYRTIPFNSAYAQASIATFLVSNSLDAARFLAEQSPLWVLGAAWIWLVVYGGSDRSDHLLLGWVIGSVIGVVILGNMYNQHFIALTPALSTAAAVVGVRSVREYARVRLLFPSAVPLAGVIILVLGGVFVVKQARLYELVKSEQLMVQELMPVTRLDRGERQEWRDDLLLGHQPSLLEAKGADAVLLSVSSDAARGR